MSEPGHPASHRIIENDLGILIALDPVHARAFTGSDREILRYWDLETGKLLAEHAGRGSAHEALHSSDMALAVLVHEGAISVWRTADGELLAQWQTPAEAQSLSEDARWLATRTQSGQIDVWECASGELRGSWTAAGAGRISFGHRNDRLLTTDETGNATLWSVPEGRELARLTGTGKLDRDYILGEQGCQVWRSDDGKPWLSATGSCRHVSADQRVLLTNHNSTWYRYSLVDRKLRGEFTMSDYPRDSALSPDGSLLAVTLGPTQVWDTIGGRMLDELPHADGLEFQPDGHELLLMSMTERPGLRVDTHTGKVLQELPPGYYVGEHGDALYMSSLRELTRWSKSDMQLRAATEPNLRLHSATLAPDGQQIAGAVDDGVQIWDAETGERGLHCEGLANIAFAQWLPGGERLLVIQDQLISTIVPSTCVVETPTIEGYTADFDPLRFRLALAPRAHGVAAAGPEGIWLFDGSAAARLLAPYGSIVDWGEGDLLAIADTHVIRVLTRSGELVGDLGRGPLPDARSTGLSRDNPSQLAWAGYWEDVALGPNGVVVAHDTERLVAFDIATGERLLETPLELPSSNSFARLSFDSSGDWLAVEISEWDRPRMLTLHRSSDLAPSWSLGSPDDDSGYGGFAWHPQRPALVVVHGDEHGPRLSAIDAGSWHSVELELPPSRRLQDPQLSSDGHRLLVRDGDDRLLIYDE